MQATTKCIRPAVSRTESLAGQCRLGNAFSPEFLDRLRHLDQPATARAAVLAGPWEVEHRTLDPDEGAHGPCWAVVRRDEPMAEGGRAFGVFTDRGSALLTAAVLPSLATPVAYHLKPHEGRLGHALHDGRNFVGHLARAEEGLLSRLHLVRALATDPEALSRLVEAAGPAAMTILGRVLRRRVG